MNAQLLDNPAERRKQVRLKVRPDLHHVEQRYEGKTFHVIKDPVCLRYYRFNKQEYFVFNLFDGQHTMEDVRKRFEGEFKPHRLEFQDLEAFARQLVTAGLVQHEAAGTGKHLFQRRAKQRRLRRLTAITNILYWKIPVFDPDRILTWMYGWLWWIFTPFFFMASIGLMLAAGLQVMLHFQAFYDKMPEYEEFFAARTLLYMWLSLGVVKIIHEFGHGLSCKAFKGECHEMGILLMCLSPALYANVTDAWTVADKWKRIIISFAGIYVELCIAAIATFVWWYTPHLPDVNYVAMCIMVLCSVSTVVFNANPLMRFDGYYMMADWLEIPNLRDRANRFLNNLFLSKCLGVEVPPEGYMAPGRKALFVVYAIASWIYRWVVTFGIIMFLSGFLHPKLKVLSVMLAMLSLASMFIWPTFKIFRYLKQRGRMPDMKRTRVIVTMVVFGLFLAASCLLPLPISRVRDTGLVVTDPNATISVGLNVSAILTDVKVTEGQYVKRGDLLARFERREYFEELSQTRARLDEHRKIAELLSEEARRLRQQDPKERLANDARLARLQVDQFQSSEKNTLNLIAQLSNLTAPQDGVAIGVPKASDVGKLYEVNTMDTRPIMMVANPARLLIKVPVSAMDYKLLKENMPGNKELDVAVYVPGRTDKSFTGKLRKLPDSDEKHVPPQLTQRGGGPLAVRQAGENGQEMVPVAQVYLIEVELTDAELAANPGCMKPGVLVQVKVYCRWRSFGWWVGRKISEALDFGLLSAG
jgi:putative peptide zinc metalloprotease protein